VVSRKTDGVLHFPLFQRLVGLRLGEGSIGAENYLLARLLLTLDLGQQQFLPTLGAGDVAGAELGGETVPVAIEQQQRVISSGLEVALSALCSCWP
jgi:hypothetical protein